jgi:hypothetical protein
MFEQVTFFSVWYWLLTAVFWSMFSYFTFGVPFDIIRRATVLGGEDAELCDRLTRRNLQRIDQGVESYGVYVAAILGFLFSTLLVSAFVVGSEVAQGLFFMLAPAGIGFFFSLRNGRRILKSELQPEELRAAVMRQRRTNQFIGAVGVIVCAIFFALKYSDRIVFLSH